MTEEKLPYQDNLPKFSATEHVRLRPGMYFGGIDQHAIHELIYQVLQDAIEEYKAGYCDHIWIIMHSHDEISIRDNGRGFPIHKVNDKHFLEIIMTEGGVLRVDGDYRITGGLRGGTGLNWVNALSSKCTVEVAREGYVWRQEYREGIPQTEVEQVRKVQAGERSGKSITLTPDFTILELNPISYELLAERASELAYLLPGLRITLFDEQQAIEEEYYFTGGLLDYIHYLNGPYSAVHEPVLCSNDWVIQLRGKREYTVAVEIAVQYVNAMDTTIIGYIDLLRTASGFHMDMLPKGILPAINERLWIERRLFSREEPPFSLAEILPGMTAIIRVKHPHPKYKSTKKINLENFDVAGIVADTIYHSIAGYEKQDMLSRIVDKCFFNRRALQEQN